MSLISNPIPNLIGGVSQQPQGLRLPTQCEFQVNALASAINGLSKRPGSRHVAKIPVSEYFHQGWDPAVRGEWDPNAFIHTINRDENEQYHLIIGGGRVRIFDLNGNEMLVGSSGYGVSATFLFNYLLNGPDQVTPLESPRESLRAVTVADHTFLLNRTITVQKEATKTPPKVHEGLIWVKQGGYGTTYTVRLDGGSFSYKTNHAESAPNSDEFITTDHIAWELTAQIDAWVASQAPGAYSVTRAGSVIYVRKNTGPITELSSSDGLGDTAIDVIKDKVTRFSQLPRSAINGMRIEVSGDASNGFDNYYVEFDADSTVSGAVSTGKWRETQKWDTYTELKKITLPLVLRRSGVNLFILDVADWEPRRVGDDASNPMPSFVGRKIRDVFFHRNRLGFVSDENVIMSRTGDYYNFFRGTVTSVLDDDPIDVGITNTKVSLLEHAVPFNEALFLFSPQAQFRLATTDVLTPSTVSVNLVTEYEASSRVRPIGSGRMLYFASKRGDHTAIREYLVERESEGLDAIDITGHVPQFIPKNVYLLDASDTESIIIALSSAQPNAIYVNNFYWDGQQKLQSAWHMWEMDQDATILHAKIIESTIHLVVQRADGGFYMEAIDLEPRKTDDGLSFSTRLDRKITDEDLLDVTFDPEEDASIVVLPYHVSDTDKITVVTRNGGELPSGKILQHLEYEPEAVGGYPPASIKLAGDLTNEPLVIGIEYEFRYRFSRFYLRQDAQNDGQTVVDDGRLQMRRLRLQYADSGYFRVEVTPKGRSTFVYPFTGRILSAFNNTIGEYVLDEGRFTAPLMSENYQLTVDIVNDTPMPCYILSGEWEGFYNSRARRV